MNFTENELKVAKSVDLCQVASALGYTVKRVGQYDTLKEMDSIRIYKKTHWFRWSRQYDRGENGGSQIDFLRVFAGMEVKDAVFWLLNFSGYKRCDLESEIGKLKNQVVVKEEKKKEFILPVPSTDHFHLHHYLNQERCIGKAVIDYFIEADLIYESRNYHNVVFKGKDKNGITRFASMRGVFHGDGKSFKCDVAGNDKKYGFNVRNVNNKDLVVFEAAIDLMSYVDICGDYESNKIALGMLADVPMETFLRENNQIRLIRLCLDNDEPGRTATASIMTKYKALGYEVVDSPVPSMYKDYNEWLQRSEIVKEQPKVKSSVR